MDSETRQHLEYLIERGHLDGASKGITKQVLERGEESLSPDQHRVFDRHVRSQFFAPKCGVCGDDVPVSEYARWEDEKLCFHCSTRMSKDD